MSVVENIAEHSNDIETEVQKMQELMMKSETGSKMLEASQEMAMSEEMIGLMEIIGDPEIPEEERMVLAEYMGEALKHDPVTGLDQYADYLDGVAADPAYAARKDYYMTISQAARSVNATEVYQKYIVAYTEFEDDKSPEAEAARKATEEMQKKMQQWANG